MAAVALHALVGRYFWRDQASERDSFARCGSRVAITRELRCAPGVQLNQHSRREHGEQRAEQDGRRLPEPQLAVRARLLDYALRGARPACRPGRPSDGARRVIGSERLVVSQFQMRRTLTPGSHRAIGSYMLSGEHTQEPVGL